MRQNETRGVVLSFLYYIYPRSAIERTIVGALFEYHRVEDLQKACEYLSDKGYIQREVKPHPYIEQKHVALYKISPSGIDLKDGLVTDPGVTILE